MTEPVPGFQQTQYAFAAYIRDPEANPPPADVPPERMATYRELFFNNIESFLGNGFPVLKAVLGPQWSSLVQRFFATHRCRTPLFIEIGQEFLEFLAGWDESDRQSAGFGQPFLLELAHYEWVELALATDEAEPPVERPLPADAGGFLASVIFLSAVAMPLAYRFPVHRIGAGHEPNEAPAEATCLAVYRDRDDRIHFLELNRVTYQLLLYLQDSGPMTARDCLTGLAGELGYPDVPRFLEFGEAILRDLAEKSLLGLAAGD